MTTVPIIAGPTAVGKTEIAVDVADRLGAEIISADSRQVYRELTIGTAKPTPAQRERVRHHFIDERCLDEPWSAGQFEAEARQRIALLSERGTRSVVTGGSTLYVHALMYGLADVPDLHPDVVALTNRELDTLGSARLHDALRAVDPVAAERIDPTNSHRVARALAVYRSTGRPIGSFFRGTEPDRSFRLVLLERDRAHLYDRINRRVDAMVNDGLLEEVRGLVTHGVDTAAPALRSIGYAELVEYLDGATDMDEAVRLIKRNSRRYAKRQLTWFRRYTDALRLDATLPAAVLVHRILSALDNSRSYDARNRNATEY